jgi:hypothetical protein
LEIPRIQCQINGKLWRYPLKLFAGGKTKK